MAKLEAGLGADDYQWLPDLLRLEEVGDITTTDPTQFVYTNDRGDTVTVTGAGFTYSGGRPTAGTINSVVVTNGADTLLTLSLLSDPLKDFADKLLDDNDPTGAARDLFDADDEFIGSAESDTLAGFSPGDDTVLGMGGHDWLAGDEGKDHLDGGTGDGFDTLSYSQTYFDKSAKKGVVLKVGKGSVKDPWGDTDTFVNFEGYWGSRFDDKFIGTGGREEFAPLGGDDNINGKGGWDLADYSWDAENGKGKKGIKADLTKGEVKDGYGDVDTIKGIETIRGTAKKDSFTGDKKDNEFDGYAGNDQFDGGKGFDLLVFYTNNFKGGGSGIVVDMGKGKVLNDGWGDTDKFKGIEAVAGTDFADTIVGSKKDDQMKGEGGNDTLTGGKGGDQFVFNPPPDSVSNHDTITDFDEAEGDRIVLWTQDGFPQLTQGDDGRIDPDQFIANAGGIPNTAEQRIVYDTLTGELFLDPDGNASAGDQVLIATLTGKPDVSFEGIEIWV